MCWIAISPADKVIQPLNKWGLTTGYTTGSRGAKFEQNVKFSLRKITDIICCEFALLVLPIFLPQVILLWALRITEIDLLVPRSESFAFRKKAKKVLRRPRKNGLRLRAIFNMVDEMAY